MVGADRVMRGVQVIERGGMRRRYVALVAVCTFAASVAACGHGRPDSAPAGPEVQIAEGDAPGTGVHWTALISRSANGLVCTQFRWNGDPNRGDGSCGGGTGPNVAREPGHTTWVIGGTEEPTAASAVVRFADARPSLSLDLVIPGPGVTDGVRYYAAGIAGGPDVTAIDIVDSAGVVVTHDTVDLPEPTGIPVPS